MLLNELMEVILPLLCHQSCMEKMEYVILIFFSLQEGFAQGVVV